MKLHIFPATVALILLTAATCNKGVSLDAQIALAANDYTALIEGCGYQVNSGFIHCRKTEGDATGENLHFVGPASECDDPEACVRFEIYYPDGSPDYSGLIPKGKTRVSVPWKTLLRRDTFELNDRGFWAYRYFIKFKDSAGHEYTQTTQGEIYMRVIRKDYEPLQSSPEAEAFAWSWSENGALVRMTSGGRTYVEKRK